MAAAFVVGACVCAKQTEAQRRPGFEGARQFENVTDGAGRPIAQRCRLCTTIVCMLGPCPGCDLRACKLDYVAEAGGVKRYYHSEECANKHARSLCAARGVATKLEKARQTLIPGTEKR